MPNDEKLLQGHFNQALLEAIEEGFLLLGKLPRQVMLENLEEYFRIKEKDISNNIAKFEDALETIFGSGAGYLERTIAQRLCEKLDLDVNDLENSGLVVCVDELKRQFLLCGERK
jgi:uncharacterized protein (DUF1499 family)